MDMNAEQKIVTIGIMALAVVLISSSLYAILAGTSTTNTTTPEEHTLSVSGVGQIKVNPDLARILLSAVAEGKTTSEAVAQNAEIVNQLINRLASMGISKDDIRTTGYNIYPIYQYPNNGSVPFIVGYRVEHSLEVSVEGTNMSQLGTTAGKIVDEAVAAGINQVSGVQFTVSEQTLKQLNDQALKLAILDASGKANLTANALGVKIVGVQSVGESSPVSYPIFYAADVKEGRSTTFIPGEVTVSSSIHIVYIIS